MTDYLEKTIAAADGLKLYARDYRPPRGVHKKRTILCLAGLTRNSKDFADLAERLCQKGHRVVTLDYRGRGQSEYDSNWENYHPRVYVNDIFNVASALGLHDCILIGTSLGGILSMVMCVLAPTLVHSVVLNDVGPDLNEDAIESIIAYTSDGEPVHDLDGAVAKLKKHYSDEEGFAERDWQRIVKNTYKFEDGMYVPDWDVKIADTLRLGQSRQERQDLWPFLKALGSRPVLLIRGGASNVFRENTYEKMLQSLTNIQGIVVPNVGHAPTLDEECLQDGLMSFLNL